MLRTLNDFYGSAQGRSSPLLSAATAARSKLQPFNRGAPIQVVQGLFNVQDLTAIHSHGVSNSG
jgi:hypothetical protein